jgi:hypothetical protein
MEWKQLTVYWRAERVHEWYSYDIELPIPNDKPLRPAMARIAAMQVLGRDHGAIVWGDDGYGYALYPHTDRKIPYRGLPGPTQE